MSSLGDFLNIAHQKYPWLTEATMEKCVVTSTDRLAAIRQALSTLKGKNKEFEEFFDDLTEAMDDRTEGMSETSKKWLKGVGRINDDAQSIIRSFERDGSPMITMGEGFETVAWMSYSAAETIQDWTKISPWWAKWITTSAQAGTLLFASMATLGLFMTRFSLEHEKTVRAFIDYGGIAGNLDTYTTLRDIYEKIGQSLGEAFEIMNSAGSLFANVNGDVLKGYEDFGKMFASMKSNPVEMLGYSVEQVQSRILAEAEILRTVSDLRSFDIDPQKKIMKGFETSTLMATMLSEATGSDRDSILAAREEALTDLDMMHAFNRNLEYMIKTYGESAADNQREFTGMLPGLLNMLDSELSNEVIKAVRGGIFDIKHNDTILDNMAPDLIKKLQLMGGGVFEQVVAFMDAGVRGEVNSKQMAAGWQTIVKSMLSAPLVRAIRGDANRWKAIEIQSAASVIPESFLNFDFYDPNLSNEIAKQQLNLASQSVQVMDTTAATLLTTLHKMVPGYGTTADTLKGYTNAVEFFANAFSMLTPGQGPLNDQDVFNKSSVNRSFLSHRNGQNNGPIRIFPNGGNTEDAIQNPGNYETEIQTIGPGIKIEILTPKSVSLDNKISTKIDNDLITKNFSSKKNQLNNSSALLLTAAAVGITNTINLNLRGLMT
tara:strand:+ start:283 stop:2259 length:1977 start_codon:yes stop_codon:yes gene_type:complete